MTEVISGQITVTTAGTAVQGTSARGVKWGLAAHPTNTGYMYVGDDGTPDVSSATGFPLAPGDYLEIELPNLNRLYVDASVSGEELCWIKLK